MGQTPWNSYFCSQHKNTSELHADYVKILFNVWGFWLKNTGLKIWFIIGGIKTLFLPTNSNGVSGREAAAASTSVPHQMSPASLGPTPPPPPLPLPLSWRSLGLRKSHHKQTSNLQVPILSHRKSPLLENLSCPSVPTPRPATDPHLSRWTFYLQLRLRWMGLMLGTAMPQKMSCRMSSNQRSLAPTYGNAAQ